MNKPKQKLSDAQRILQEQISEKQYRKPKPGRNRKKRICKAIKHGSLR